MIPHAARRRAAIAQRNRMEFEAPGRGPAGLAGESGSAFWPGVGRLNYPATAQRRPAFRARVMAFSYSSCVMGRANSGKRPALNAGRYCGMMLT